MNVSNAKFQKKFDSRTQGRNKVYGIRDQRKKMGWDQGSQAVGSGSVLPQGDQSFPHNNKDHKILKCALLIGGTCQHLVVFLL